MKTISFATTNIRLPASDLRALKIIAVKSGKSLSGLLREITSLFLVEAEEVVKNIEDDAVWKWGNKPVKTGDPLLSQKIDKILYG